MKIIDETLLSEFRAKTCCEVCLRFATVFPHHWHARGLSSGSRIDLAVNLLSVCLPCHNRIHAGNIDRKYVLRIIARRERKSPEECVQEIHDMLRKEKPL